MAVTSERSVLKSKVPNSLLRYGGFVASVGGARVAGIMISSVTFPFLVRRLGVETYGLWSYVVALCAFLDLIANPGLSTHTAQKVAALRYDAAKLVPDFLVLRVGASLLALGVLFILSRFEIREDVRWLLRWYGMGSLCIGLTTSDFLLNSLEFFHARSLLSVIQQVLYATGILSLIRTPKDVIWLPFSILGSALLTNLAGWLLLWHKGFRLQWTINPRRWRGILIPSFHYAATTMMATLYHRTGHLAVRWFLGEQALGLYAAALRLVDILRNLVNVIFSVAMPRIAFSAQSAAGTKRLVQAAVSAVAAISIPLMIGTLLTAQLVVPFVMGARFAAAVSPTRWMAAYVLAAPSGSLLSGTILYALGRHRACLASATAGAVTAILLYAILLPIFGLVGACIAFVLAEVAVAITAYMLIPRDLRDLWKNPILGFAALSTLVMAAALKIVNTYSSQLWLVIAVGAGAYLIAFGLLSRKPLMQQFLGG